MIIQTVNNTDFHDAFRTCGRIEQFSCEARNMLFDHLEEMSEGSGEPYELDVIALCCEFYESSAEEIANNYSEAPQLEDFDGDEGAHEEAIKEWLNDQTLLVGKTSGSFVYACF